MIDLKPQFVSSDCWLLLAIVYASSDEEMAGLAEMIGAADYINHAIPTTAELDGAINRLLAARLIRHDKGHFAATPAARSLVAKISTPRKANLDVWEDLAKLIACPCCGPKLTSVRRRVTVTTAAVQEAYETYRKRIEPKRGKR